jgi:hypothetical protein
MPDRPEICQTKDQQIGLYGAFDKCPRFASQALFALRGSLHVLDTKQGTRTKSRAWYHQDFFFDLTDTDKEMAEESTQQKKGREDEDDAVISAFGGIRGSVSKAMERETHIEGGFVSQKMTVQSDGTFEISMEETEAEDVGFEITMGDEDDDVGVEMEGMAGQAEEGQTRHEEIRMDKNVRETTMVQQSMSGYRKRMKPKPSTR